MDFIDFSLDSRIRRTYVPLINQQRFLRHIKRISARNLCIPQSAIEWLLANNSEEIDGEEDENDDLTPLVAAKFQLRFFFTINIPPKDNCDLCQCQTIPLKERFSCKCDRILYRSEPVSSSNPSWKSFEGHSLCSPSIPSFVIRVYFESPKQEAPRLFLQWQVSLSGLVYVGEEIPKDRRLAKNCLLFGFAEGFYTSICSVVSNELLEQTVPPSESIQVNKSLVRESYQLDTLTKIQMVQYIRQATAAQRAHIKRSLEQAIEKTSLKREIIIKVEKLQTSLMFLESLVENRKRELEVLEEQHEKNENEIFERNNEVCNQIQKLKEEKENVVQLRHNRMIDTRLRLEEICNHLLHRRRVLAKELFHYIYRILPFPDNSGYSICDIYLPESESVDKHDAKMISVALGYVTHLLSIIVLILDYHLSYQIDFLGSRSTIVDNLQPMLKNKEKVLPLYPRSSRDSIFFKRGLYLLNRNISYLRRSLGLKTQSIAITLANLYSMFTDCLLVDNYNINADYTLNHFCPYSPSFDLIDPNQLAHSSQAFNQQFLNDIHSIKDDDTMVDGLWKEVEQMTIAVAKSESFSPNLLSLRDTTSLSSSHSSTSSLSGSFMDSLKQSINRQRQTHKNVSNQRLSQITSSIESSYSNNTQNPSHSTAPKEIRTRRVSTSSMQPNQSSSASCSYMFRHSPRTVQFLNWHRKLRTSSSTSAASSVSTTRSSFLFPNIAPQDRYNVDFLNQSFDTAVKAQQYQRPTNGNFAEHRLASSLDKGLERIARTQSRASSMSSISIDAQPVLASDFQSPERILESPAYLNLETNASQKHRYIDYMDGITGV